MNRNNVDEDTTSKYSDLVKEMMDKNAMASLARA